jgi:hypothetical protein
MVLSFAGGQARAQVAGVPTPGLTSSRMVAPVAIGPGSTVYLAGRSRYGTQSGHWVVFDGVGVWETAWPDVDGTVEASAPDGSGGWFIAGWFTHVAGQPRAHLAHIEAGGALDPEWAPAPNDTVRALIVLGGTVYIGGDFTSIDGQPRKHLAALDGASGRLGPWRPEVDDHVDALAGAGGLIYAGGDFWRAGGARRGHLAAFDAGSGAITAWDPDAFSGSIHTHIEALAVNAGRLYAAGDFATVDGRDRFGLAAFDVATGALTAWDPKPDFPGASAIAVQGETVYVGGFFDRIGNARREHLAALDALTGRALPWRADVEGADGYGLVSALAVVGDQLYLGGSFDTIAGQPRANLAAVDATTGAVSPWDPRPSDVVWSLAAANAQVVAGGDFAGINSQYRDRLAAIDLNTGALLPFDPTFRSTTYGGWVDVKTAAPNGDTVFAGGAQRHGSRRRLYLVQLDARTGRMLRSNPLGGSSGAINALVVHGSRLFVGGRFSRIGGHRRRCLAALDTRTARPTPWHADTNGVVHLFVVAGRTLYIAGNFTRVDGHRRIGAAAIDLRSSRLTRWNPNLDHPGVTAIAVAGKRVYLAGHFQHVAGRHRRYLAAVSRSDGRVQRWNPRVNSGVNTITVIDDTLYLGGKFTSVSGAHRRHIAALHAATGTPTAWNPGASGEVFSLLATPAGLLVSGQYGALAGVSLAGLGMFPRISHPAAYPPAPSATGGIEERSTRPLLARAALSRLP